MKEEGKRAERGEDEKERENREPGEVKCEPNEDKMTVRV